VQPASVTLSCIAAEVTKYYLNTKLCQLGREPKGAGHDRKEQIAVKDSDRDKSMGRASGWKCRSGPSNGQDGGNSPETITAKAVETENCHKKLQLRLPGGIRIKTLALNDVFPYLMLFINKLT